MSDYLPALPDEVVAATILWRLPVESIVQCRRVCKSWYSLVTNPNFISTHLLRSKALTPKNPQMVLEETGRCLLVFGNHDSMSFHLPHLPNDPCVQILGSFNGLICFSIGEIRLGRIVNLILCNPSIGKFQSIPPPLSVSSVKYWAVRGFGFDERTLDFNILLISPREIGFIYSLKSNSWRSVTCPFPDNWSTKPAVFVNGRFHWIARDLFTIIQVFDMKSNTFSCISLPECLTSYPCIDFEIREYGESSIAITIHREHAYHLWIMKEYGTVKSWIKLTMEKVFLGFKNKDEVITGFARPVSRKINYNKLELEEAELMDFEEVQLLSMGHKYMPSLVLLDKENNVDVAAPTYTKRIKAGKTAIYGEIGVTMGVRRGKGSEH